MNTEQQKSFIRWFLTYIGGTVTGYITAKNWLTVEQISHVTSFFTNETVVTLVLAVGTAVGTAIRSYFNHSKKNVIAVVDAMPEVVGVVTRPTMEGRELAQSVPSPTVVTAGTPAASLVAVGKAVI